MFRIYMDSVLCILYSIVFDVNETGMNDDDAVKQARAAGAKEGV